MSDSDMAKRIKELRLALGLTLEEVATQVGVGKSTVRKWETGIIANMKRDKIASLAKALHTSPGYLMGWTDTNKTAVPLNDSIELNEHEKRMVLAYREQPDTQPFVDKLLGIDEEPMVVLAARGGKIKLDKETAAKLAKSADAAPNSSQDRDVF